MSRITPSIKPCWWIGLLEECQQPLRGHPVGMNGAPSDDMGASTVNREKRVLSSTYDVSLRDVPNMKVTSTLSVCET